MATTIKSLPRTAVLHRRLPLSNPVQWPLFLCSLFAVSLQSLCSLFAVSLWSLCCCACGSLLFHGDSPRQHQHTNRCVRCPAPRRPHRQGLKHTLATHPLYTWHNIQSIAYGVVQGYDADLSLLLSLLTLACCVSEESSLVTILDISDSLVTMRAVKGE